LGWDGFSVRLQHAARSEHTYDCIKSARHSGPMMGWHQPVL
jgi:hypothetical protein